ncbi:uncharacterized protein LOC142918167 isoform X2 [Petromyzon marinus]|uniref:uncharacterized protein LOC142918167 isoform X2 n=1 Tax=Petromyzon marinus TaxID=7757 RepID=UPI003F721101
MGSWRLLQAQQQLLLQLFQALLLLLQAQLLLLLQLPGTSGWPPATVFPCPGSVLIGEASHLLEAKQQAGSWCRDSLQATDKVYVMPWTPFRTDRLVEYASLQDILARRPLTNYKLPHRVDGTGFVVYDGAVFFNRERTRSVVKFDLRTRVKGGEAFIPNANYYDTSPYRWGGKSDIDLAADERGLWVIYATEQNHGRMVVSRLNPRAMRVEASFETAYVKRLASDAFMACGVLHVLRSTYEDDGDGGADAAGGGGGGEGGGTSDRIDYVYDTDSRRDARVSVPFPNPFRFITSVQYNARDRALYVWNNHHALRYALRFGTRDPAAVFPCPGSVLLVGEASHLLEAKQQAGSWCRDPLQATDKVYVMPWTPFRTDRLVEYASLQDILARRPLTNYKLPHRVDGTGFVVYDGAVFFNRERTRSVVKFDLRTRVKGGEAFIPNANYYDTSPYRWGGKSDIDLAADERGLWVIYATEQNHGRMVVSRLNPRAMRVEASFETAYVKRLASDAFMACGVLHVLRSTYEDDGDGGADAAGGGGGGEGGGTSDRIDYVYDTDSRRDARVSVPFPNPFRFITSVQYNARDRALYVWNNHHALRYALRFGTRDPAADVNDTGSSRSTDVNDTGSSRSTDVDATTAVCCTPVELTTFGLNRQLDTRTEKAAAAGRASWAAPAAILAVSLALVATLLLLLLYRRRRRRQQQHWQEPWGPTEDPPTLPKAPQRNAEGDRGYLLTLESGNKADMELHELPPQPQHQDSGAGSYDYTVFTDEDDDEEWKEDF